MNSVWLLGALTLWFVVIPRVMNGRWRIEVLRIQWLYSFAHALAIFDVLTGKTKEWVATGAATTRTTPLALSVLRLARGYTLITFLAVWAGLTRGIYEYGIGRYWAIVALSGLAAYIQLPILYTRAAGEPLEATSVVDLRTPALTALELPA
jgi:cellulose synthase (UDP-forming)